MSASSTSAKRTPFFPRLRKEVEQLRAEARNERQMHAETAASYRCLANLSSDGLLVISGESGNVIEVEERAAELLSRPIIELPGTPARDLFEDREQGRWNRLVAKVVEGRPVTADSMLLAASCNKRQWVDLRLTVIPDQRVKSLMLVMHDATERQKQYTLSQRQISFLHEMSSSLPRFRSFEEVLSRLSTVLVESLDLHAFAAVLPDPSIGAVGYVYAGKKTPLSFINEVKKSISSIATEMSEKVGRSASFTVSRREDFPTTEMGGALSQLMLPMAGTDGVAGVFSGAEQAFKKEDLSMFSSTLSTLSALYLAFQAYQEVERLSVTDSLTGLYNRRKFFEEMSREWERARRYGSRLSLIMLDLDHFKQVNDNYGHQCGDDVLRATAAVLSASTRKTDVVARYGGEEFIVMLTETGPEGAAEVAERIRNSIALATVSDSNPELRCTASLGVTTFRPSGSVDKLVMEADEALYCAKSSGRNRVEFYGMMADTIASK